MHRGAQEEVFASQTRLAQVCEAHFFIIMGGNKMKNTNTKVKNVSIVIACILILLGSVFLIGRYGWKLMGFNACETAGIEHLNVENGHVRIRGFYPGSFPQGFLG